MKDPSFTRDFDFSDLSLDSRNLEKVFEASAEVEIRGIDLIQGESRLSEES